MSVEGRVKESSGREVVGADEEVVENGFAEAVIAVGTVWGGGFFDAEQDLV